MANGGLLNELFISGGVQRKVCQLGRGKRREGKERRKEEMEERCKGSKEGRKEGNEDFPEILFSVSLTTLCPEEAEFNSYFPFRLLIPLLAKSHKNRD